ncbi:MAG: polyprenol monophosphomannose synthase [Steroidobacteraceae bacterium]
MRALVIVPTYNERENIRAIASGLLAIPDVRLMVVDDRSPDGTGAIADALAEEHRSRVTVIHRAGTRGLGRSYVEGMQHALAHSDAALICQMDADLSHMPSDLPRLLAAAANADLVIGSRYVSGGRVINWPRRRVLLSTFANHYVRVLTRLDVRDVTSGFRCWRRHTLQQIPLTELRSDGYAFQVEMTWHAGRAGARIVEVPITFVERRQGESKLSGRVIAESVLLPLRLATRRLPGNRPRCTL